MMTFIIKLDYAKPSYTQDKDLLALTLQASPRRFLACIQVSRCFIKTQGNCLKFAKCTPKELRIIYNKFKDLKNNGEVIRLDDLIYLSVV